MFRSLGCAFLEGEKENSNDRGRQRERESRVRVEGLFQVCAVPEPQHSYKSKFGLIFLQRVLIVLNSERLFSSALSSITFTVSEEKNIEAATFSATIISPCFFLSGCDAS